MIKTVPYVCPVSDGCGEILRQERAPACSCKGCEGTGVVWGTVIDVDVTATLQQERTDSRLPPQDWRIN